MIVHGYLVARYGPQSVAKPQAADYNIFKQHKFKFTSIIECRTVTEIFVAFIF